MIGEPFFYSLVSTLEEGLLMVSPQIHPDSGTGDNNKINWAIEDKQEVRERNLCFRLVRRD